jgi:hypothetical protein
MHYHRDGSAGLNSSFLQKGAESIMFAGSFSQMPARQVHPVATSRDDNLARTATMRAISARIQISRLLDVD